MKQKIRRAAGWLFGVLAAFCLPVTTFASTGVGLSSPRTGESFPTATVLIIVAVAAVLLLLLLLLRKKQGEKQDPPKE